MFADDLEQEADPADAPPTPVPTVAIVGRPNVGKSTLLNALVGARVSIVEASPGVTRDRVSVVATVAGQTVEVVDTGGIGIVDRDGLEQHVEAQVELAVSQAAVILFLVDVREGRTALDERVAGMLRRASGRVVLVANKAEAERHGWNLGDFHALGHGEPLAISAQERIGLGDLEERIAALLPRESATVDRLASPDLRLAVVGRVNAGKSSLVNALLQEERMIVSEVPGTTRDSVDIRFERDGRAIVLIDTAGIRKERRVQGSVEFYAQRRSEKAMRRADVTALVLDASAEVGRIDREIAGRAVAGDHPLLIVANKWDLAPPGVSQRMFRSYLDEVLRAFPFAPIVYTSAKTRQNVRGILDAAFALFDQANTRVSTARVNRTLEAAQTLRRPRARHGRMGRIYYGTQADVAPPTFVLFVNDPALFDQAYLRYLSNRFREALPMEEIPLRFELKARVRPEQRGVASGDSEEFEIALDGMGKRVALASNLEDDEDDDDREGEGAAEYDEVEDDFEDDEDEDYDDDYDDADGEEPSDEDVS